MRVIFIYIYFILFFYFFIFLGGEQGGGEVEEGVLSIVKADPFYFHSVIALSLS